MQLNYVEVRFLDFRGVPMYCQTVKPYKMHILHLALFFRGKKSVYSNSRRYPSVLQSNVCEIYGIAFYGIW